MKAKQLLGPNEMGAVIGVTGRTMLNLESRGVVTATVRVGRIVRFDPEAVLAQLAEATAREASRRQG